MGNSVLGLLFQISADPSKAQEALAQFERSTGTSLHQVVDKTEEMNKSLLDSHNSIHLLSQEMGIRLPRAVIGAIAEVKGLGTAFQLAGEAALVFFTMREVAEAIESWSKFKDKVTEVIGPISELEVKAANALGFLEDYADEATKAAELGQRHAEETVKLSERILKAENDISLARAQGVEKVRLEHEQTIQSLTLELARTDQANKQYYLHLIDLEKQKEAIEVQRAIGEEVAKAGELEKEFNRLVAEAVKHQADLFVQGLQRQEWAREEFEKNTAAIAADIAVRKKAAEAPFIDDLDAELQATMALGAQQLNLTRGTSGLIEAHVHLSAARSEEILIMQAMHTANQKEIEAVGKDLPAAMQNLTAGLAGLIGGNRAAAAAKAVFETARGIELLADATWPPNPAALVAAGLHFEAAAEFAKIAGTSSHRHAGGAGGAGAGTGRSSASGGYGSGRDREGLPSPATLAQGAGGRFGTPGVMIVHGSSDFYGFIAGAINEAVNRGHTVTSTSAMRGSPVGH